MIKSGSGCGSCGSSSNNQNHNGNGSGSSSSGGRRGICCWLCSRGWGAELGGFGAQILEAWSMLGVAQTVFLVNHGFVPMPKRGRFDENGENDEFAFYPLKTRASLLRPLKTTRKWRKLLITLPQKESGKRSLAKKWRKKWQKKWPKSDRKKPEKKRKKVIELLFADLLLRHPVTQAKAWLRNKNRVCSSLTNASGSEKGVFSEKSIF